MKRNLKALGLALMAAFAMSAVAASGAQALTQGEFTQPQGNYPVAITGHEEEGTDNFFEITPDEDASRTHCNDVTYEATLTQASTKLTVTPHYTECEATTPNGDFPAEVDLNGCDYVFEANTTKSATETEGSVEIACPSERQIEVTVGPTLCAVDIPPQTIEGGITYTNVANGDVTVDVNISKKITYIETDRSIFCPLTNNEHREDGNFVSSVLVTGYEDLGTHPWITKEGHPDVEEFELETLTEGVARDIDVG